VALGYYCSKSRSSYSALSVCTSTTILLDLARMFSELEMTVHVLRSLVVSVLLPVVELLRSGACGHLVSLPHNVCLDDLETVVPAVDDRPRRDVLSCLVRLHGLEPLVDLIVTLFLGRPTFT
jgi:hypothetical protein